MNEASSTDTPYGRYITSDGWFVLNLADALAVRNEEKGGATYPIESKEHPFADLGVHVDVLWPGNPNALYHSEAVQEGFLVLSGQCTLIVDEEERELRQWDYFHCPAGTSLTRETAAQKVQAAELAVPGVRRRRRRPPHQTRVAAPAAARWLLSGRSRTSVT